MGFLVQGLQRNAVEISSSRGFGCLDILFDLILMLKATIEDTPESHDLEVILCVLAENFFDF